MYLQPSSAPWLCFEMGSTEGDKVVLRTCNFWKSQLFALEGEQIRSSCPAAHGFSSKYPAGMRWVQHHVPGRYEMGSAALTRQVCDGFSSNEVPGRYEMGLASMKHPAGMIDCKNVTSCINRCSRGAPFIGFTANII